jgi:hypothetical protein
MNSSHKKKKTFKLVIEGIEVFSQGPLIITKLTRDKIVFSHFKSTIKQLKYH